MFKLLVILAIYFEASFASTNYEPIIGVLSQQTTKSFNENFPGYHSYIAASYVKFMESGGARVIPIWIDRPEDYYKDIMTKVNGVLFPGGAAPFSKTKGYSKAGKYIYDIAVEMNEKEQFMPILGICLGFELLPFVSSNMEPNRVPCFSKSQALPLDFKSDFRTSKLFKSAPQSVIDILAKENVTPNFHNFCLTDKVFAKKGLDKEWRSITTNKDKVGIEFISTMEHRKYPFYGLQFHPEKNIFEWVNGKNISHTANAVMSAQYFTNFFANETRKNSNRFATSTLEQQYLIYNFPTTYTGVKVPIFQESYFFKEDTDYNFNNTESVSTADFSDLED